jgi:hypothetical protein
MPNPLRAAGRYLVGRCVLPVWIERNPNEPQLIRKRQGPMAQNPRLAALSAAGVSIWLDDLSRDRLASGNLAQLIATHGVVGVTTNPSIFQAALSHGHAYDDPHRHHR